MTKKSFTNIFEAARRGTVDDVRHFVEQQGADVNAEDQHGFIPLMSAIAENADIEVFKYLLSKGESYALDTLLISAKEMGNAAVAEYLTHYLECSIKAFTEMKDRIIPLLDDGKKLEADCMKLTADAKEDEDPDECFHKMIESLRGMNELYLAVIERNQEAIEKFQKAIDL
jgi:hypothetical protein